MAIKISGTTVIDDTRNLTSINTTATGNVTVTGFANVSTTLAAGNTTITGFANVSSNINAVSFNVGATQFANTTGVYATFMNSKTEGNLNVNNATTAYSKTEGNLNVNNATTAYSKAESALNVNSALTANNSTNLNGQAASFYTNATNINTGTLPYAQIPANVINTTAEFTRTGITTFSANIVLGSSGLSANGGFGTAGQVLHSNGTATYWAADDNSGGTVTSVATGNGMTGGTITTTGTVSILANTGVVANATGVFVNSAYIATIAANNASFLGTVAAASYVQNTDSRTLSGNLVISGTSFTPSSNTVLLGNSTQRWVLSANTGSFSGAVSGITTLAAGNTTVTGFVNATSSVNAASLTVGTSTIANTTGVYTGIVNAATHSVGTAFTANATVVNAVSYNVGTRIVANTTVVNATHLEGVAASSYYRSGSTDVALADGGTNASLTASAGAIAFSNTTSLALTAVGTSGHLLTSAGAGTPTWASTLTPNLTLSGNTIFSGSNTTVNAEFRVINSTANVFFVAANGNVGIGNTSPAHKLRVTGTSSLAGAVSDITTLAAGNTTITGFVNASTGSITSNGLIYSSNLILQEDGTHAYVRETRSGGDLYLGANNTNHVIIAANGSVGVGTTSPAYKLQVNGSFAATTKSFVIDHPTKPDMKLRYGSLEGPENGVYVRGRLDNQSVIELPEYWWNLVDERSITVNLTAMGMSQDLWVQSVSSRFVHLNQLADCFFTVFAERKDVDRLVVEF